MRPSLKVLSAAMLLSVSAAGCCAPCVPLGRLGVSEPGALAAATPTADAQPVWFELWAEATVLRRSQGEAAIPYRMLTWCIYDGDVSRLQRAADAEMAFDMGWMRPGTYTVCLKAWWDGEYHQVSDTITVEVPR